MRFLVDVGVGRQVEQWLAANGHEMLAVRDLDPRMPDRDIIRRAAAEGRMIITMDKDFGELVFNARLAHAGVLLLRLDRETGGAKTEIVRRLLRDYAGQLGGKFCVYQNGILRIRAR